MFKLLLLLLLILKFNYCKYLEGELHTSDNWAFLARFCFLSENGQFEYNIEFNDEQGIPNLLLYYDTDDQWPAVYKTNKNCWEKESVLHIEQNQIINLTTINMYYRELSGCIIMPDLITEQQQQQKQQREREQKKTTPHPRYTLNIPTINKRRNFTRKTTSTSTTIEPTISTTLSTSTIFITSTNDDFDWLNNSKTPFSDITSTYSITTVPTITETIKVPINKRAVPPKPPFYRNNVGKQNIICHNARRFRSSRERWWFIAISNCNGTKGIHIKYKLLMTNGPPGDYWHEHFSADEFYILPVLMAFSVAYGLLLLAIIMCSIELKSRQLLHTTYKIFVFSVLFQLFGIVFETAAYIKYAINGYGGYGVRRFGFLLMGISETLFLLLLLLLAKGYTITRGRLPIAASIKITIFMCLYVVTYVSIVIYEANVFDPGEVLYVYESPAGYGLIILRIIAWCMFIYSTVFTLKHYPEKSNFYYPFNIFGTLWHIAGPIFILTANTYIDKWVRESVVCAVLQFITFSGHLMFLILTMPSVANKNFPYHVRTTQIGIMELDGVSCNNGNIEQFGHHVYEPTGNLREQTIIVPLTRRTEEIFEGMYNQQQQQHQRSQQQDQLQQQQQLRDITMENVLNWSLARNLTVLEPQMNFRQRINSFASTPSRNGGDHYNSLSSSITNNQYQTNDDRSGTIEDYVRDVPLELFTVSRMIVANKDNNKNQENKEN